MLYLGAGLSIPPPSHGPKGNEVAEKLRPFVAELLGVEPDDLGEATLEDLASRVKRDLCTHLEELKDRAAAVWGFRDMEPNLGHELVALMMREGLVKVASANWDCGVENAGLRLEVAIEGVSTSQARLALAARTLPLFKVHGCATRPETLILTRDEVDAPQRWARAEVETALTGGVVAFVGLGTVGAYVGEPVEELVGIWVADRRSVRVVDPYGPSDDWEKVLGDQVNDAAVEMPADLFMDELARAAVLDALSRTDQRAREIHATENAAWSQAMVDGMSAIRSAFDDRTAIGVLRWWRDGVTSDENGNQFVFQPAGQTSLLCVAQLIGLHGGEVLVDGDGAALSVRNDGGYYEIEHKPTAMRREVEQRARARIARRRRDGRYEAGRPVVVAIHGADGAFPSLDAKPDIAASDRSGPDIAAGDDDDIRIVRAEDATNGTLAA